MYKKYCKVFNPIQLIKSDQMIKNKKFIFGQADNFSVTHYTAVKSAFHFLCGHRFVFKTMLHN